MSDIRFCTTPIGDLPNYFYIFSNLDPLGKELNNVVCYRLGTMLYIDIPKGKDTMKTL